MQVVGAFPAGCAFHCDFVDRTRAWVGADERVIDLQVDCEDLPHMGTLAIHQNTVEAMVAALGWKLQDPDDDHNELLKIIANNEALHEENRALRKALAAVGKEPTSIPEAMAS
jgi:hypothetical protein